MNEISGVFYGCQDTLDGNISLTSVYIFIILHQLLIYPSFHKFTPSLLKRIGLGMVLVLLANINHVLAFIGSYNIGEMFHFLTAFDEKVFAV